MRIVACEVYGYTLTYVHGEYVMPGGRAVQTQDITLIRLLTDDGGNSDTRGNILPDFVGGRRASIQDLASYWD